jgi:hypothetical protein
MHSASEKVAYWIQRADFTSREFEPVSLAEALAVLHGHDWQAELGYERSLEASGKAAEERCAPGIGFVADAGHVLHICPKPDGMAECYFIGPSSSDVSGVSQQPNVNRHEQDRLLESFFRGDYAQLVQGFAAPLEMSCRVLRADGTCTPDSGAITLEKAQRLLGTYDWKAELEYCSALAKAGKDSCAPLIGFTARTGSFLDIQLCDDGVAQCFFWDERHKRGWGRHGLSSEEQCRAVEFLFQGDSQSLSQGWNEFEVEAEPDDQGQFLWTMKGPGAAPITGMRDEWLALTREVRARRGKSAELTESEQNSSEAESYALYRREAELENEDRSREEAIQGARSAQKWSLIVAAGGALLGWLVYSGMLESWFSDQVTKDLRGWSVMMLGGGVVLGTLTHLQLRALRLATPSARRLSDAANVLVAGLMGIVGVLAVALFFVFAAILMLGPGGFTDTHFIIALCVVVGAMITVALLGGYWGYRSDRDGSEHGTALEFGALAMVPFLWVGLGVNFLALLMAVSAAHLQGSWIDQNLSIALKIATAVTAVAVGTACWFRLKKNGGWAQQGLAVALLALVLVAVVQMVQTFGASRDRPSTGPTMITKALFMPQVVATRQLSVPIGAVPGRELAHSAARGVRDVAARAASAAIPASA